MLASRCSRLEGRRVASTFRSRRESSFNVNTISQYMYLQTLENEQVWRCKVYQTESLVLLLSRSPSSVQKMSIVALSSVSCAEAKLVTLLVGIPSARQTTTSPRLPSSQNTFTYEAHACELKYARDVNTPEKTQHCPNRTGCLPS